MAKNTSDLPVRKPVGSAAAAPYARVKQFLKDGLQHGVWPPGTLMPSEAELVAVSHYVRGFYGGDAGAPLP